MKPKPPMTRRNTLPTINAGTTRLKDSRLGEPIRLSASMRRRTSDVRAIASPWTGHGRAARRASRARTLPYETASPKTFDGDGIADGVARCRMRRGNPPGKRVEPEHDRGEVCREVPGKVVIPRVCQFVGQDRPQVVGPHVFTLSLRQQQHGAPESGQAGSRHLRRQPHSDRPPTSQLPGESPALLIDRGRHLQ